MKRIVGNWGFQTARRLGADIRLYAEYTFEQKNPHRGPEASIDISIAEMSYHGFAWTAFLTDHSPTAHEWLPQSGAGKCLRKCMDAAMTGAVALADAFCATRHAPAATPQEKGGA
ncbi:MAG: hypothetical protein FJ279_02175 [Planctomycetes bacterium]|nr:hypothetical protein [Planctomycetota bacterium]